MRLQALNSVVRALALPLCFAVLLAPARPAMPQTPDQPPRLLFIVESDSRLPLVRSLMAGIEVALGPEFTTHGEIYVEYLDMLRFGGKAELDLIGSFLSQRYRDITFDAIGVLGPNALAYVLASRADLAPGVPIIFGGFGDAGLATALSRQMPPDLGGVISTFDVLGTLDLALTLQPDAPEIVVIAGSAMFDRQWRTTFGSAVGDTYRGRPVRLLPEATAEAYLTEARSLDPAAIVLLLSVNIDAGGRRFLPAEFAEILAEASPAPVWSVYEPQIGRGIVGGMVEDLASTGREIGRLLRLAVDGAPLPAPVRVGSVPTVDWRQMKRHGLDIALLPDGSRILFHEPGFWEEHRALLLSIAAVVLAQAATILALLFQSRRYLDTRNSLEAERSHLIHVSRNMRLGQLSASLAHEINQPLAAIQANAEAGARLSRRASPDLEEIGDIFGDITDDVRRAGSTISNLRRLMVKGEVVREKTDLNDIVSATLPLVQNELEASGTRVQVDLSPGPLEVDGNDVQLQQIVLNLVLNAAEAMNGQTAATRSIRLTTARQPAGGVSLTVDDSGPGIATERREDAFRPFVSTKETGLGVGLAICRSIAQAHGGSLAFADPGGSGARIVLSLPARGGQP
jgi:signal transduction histidine kinase